MFPFNSVLIANSINNEDKHMGFTDVIMSAYLPLSASYSFDIRLSFQYSIANKDDFIDIYRTDENRTHIVSFVPSKSLANERTNISDDNEPIWQQANVTFQAIEQFRVRIDDCHVHRN
jgi:hypothetical protein